MMKRLLMPVLFLGLGFGLLTTLPSPGAEAVSAEKITKLIAQLGSNEFDDREQAQKQLDAIGEPALAALKKAMSSDDIEVRRRSEELIAKIEQRAASAKVLQPTKIHLVYKDTPLVEALADFSKKSGYSITVHDPENKLKDRKITLDTGDTVFWIAYDKFCAAAELVEAKPEDLIPKVQPGQPGQPGGPDVAPNPAPRPARPIRGTPAQPATPAEKPEEKPAEQQKGDGNAQPAKAQAQVQVQVQVQVQPAQPAQPPQAIARPIVRPIGVGVQARQGQIVLIDGKTKEAPTDYSSAIRIRAMEKNDTFAAQDGQYVLGLQVSPEPNIAWQNLINVIVTKAVDEKDQTLAQAANENPGAVGAPGVNVAPGRIVIRPGLVNVPAYLGLHQEIPVYLKKGDKKTTKLKELTGVIQAQVLDPAKVVITTDDVFKSANKTFTGGDKGSIKVIAATKDDNGQVQVRFEMQAPEDFVPANTINNGVNVMPGKAPVAPRLPKAGLQAQAAPAILIRPARQQFGAGLQAIDDKGNTIPVAVQQQVVVENNVQRVDTVAIFQLAKEQTVAKLVFSGSRSVTVEVPFTLKDVTLP